MFKVNNCAVVAVLAFIRVSLVESELAPGDEVKGLILVDDGIGSENTVNKRNPHLQLNNLGGRGFGKRSFLDHFLGYTGGGFGKQGGRGFGKRSPSLSLENYGGRGFGKRASLNLDNFGARGFGKRGFGALSLGSNAARGFGRR